MSEKPAIIPTVVKAYAFFFTHFFHAMKLAWPAFFLVAVPLALFLVALAAAYVGLLPDLNFNFKFKAQGASGIALGFLVTATVILTSAYFMAFALIGWHRANLHGVSKENFANPFKPKRQEVEFFGKTILFYILMLIFSLVAMFPALGLGSVIITKMPGSVILPITVSTIIMLAAYCLVMLLSARFMFYFPAKADNRHIGFSDSFYLFKGLTWRFAIVVSLVYLPVLLADTFLPPVQALILEAVSTSPLRVPYGYIHGLLYPAIELSIWYIMLPFLTISVLCEFYVWRRDKALESEIGRSLFTVAPA